MLKRSNPEDLRRHLDWLCQLVEACNQVPPWPSLHPGGWSAQRVREELLEKPSQKGGFKAILVPELACLIIHHSELVQGALHVQQLLVHPRHRREGWAQQMLAELEGPLTTSTYLPNTAGIEFFMSQGFTELRRDPGAQRIHFTKNFKPVIL